MSTKQTTNLALLASVVLALAFHGTIRDQRTLVPAEAFAVAPAKPAGHEVSGAYNALSFWGDSRVYPGDEIPRDAYMRAYEYAQANLQPLPNPQRSAPAWQPIGPVNGGGRMLNIAFHPTNPNTMYAGSASGGLWRTTTGGVGATAWHRIDTGQPILGVSTIEFDPANPNVMYIGTGEVYNFQTAGDLEADRRTRGSYGVGILKSTDGGTTWTNSLDWSYDQRHGVWAVRVDPTNSNIVWAATTDGVYKSTDAGANWTVDFKVIMANDLVIHPTSPDTVLVACGNLGSGGRGIYRTTDGGQNWSQITGGGIPADFQGKIQFGVTPADENVVYASIGNGFEVFGPDNATWLLRSTDFGANFNLVNTTDYSRWQGWYAHDVAVHPQDPNTVICIGIDIWKSTDGGSTLTQKSDYTQYFTGNLSPGGPEGTNVYSHADHHDVIYHPTNSSIVYFANDGGIFRSDDGGETFAGANGGLQTQQFYNGTFCSAVDPDLAMGGLQDFASVIYQGNGEWTRWVLGGDGGWCAIDPANTNRVYATAQFLFAGRSNNGGASFTGISPPDLGGPVAFLAPFLLAQQDTRIIYAGSNYLFKSFDRGNQWFIGQGGNEIDGNPLLLLAVSPQNDDVLYLATAPLVDRGRVHRTLDGGSNFTDLTGTLPDRYPADLAVDPTDEATVYLTLSGFGTSHVFRSTDYGSTWVDIDNGLLPDVPTTSVIVDPDFPDHVYIGNDIGVFATLNGGSNWFQLADGLSEATLAHDLNISQSNRMLRLFTHGQGVFERPLLTDCPADIDGDNVVGLSDLAILLANFGLTGATPEEGDVQPDGGDGDVDLSDLAELLTNFGQSCN